MLAIVLVMFGILLLAGLVVLYVAFPHRGAKMPVVPWVGRLMRKGADKVPVHRD